MKHNHVIEAVVGLFLIVAFAALLVLAFWVSGLTTMSDAHTYVVYANFDNVGGLKVRAPVAIAGVKIGKVQNITLDPKTFRARVTLQIDNQFHELPLDSSASILTQGILGANYISIGPGFEEKPLEAGDTIETTHSALILENVIGQMIYKVKNDDKKTDPNGNTHSANKEVRE